MSTNLSIKSRLVFVIAFLSVLLAATGVLGLASLDSANDTLKKVYEDRQLALGKLERMAMPISKNQIIVAVIDKLMTSRQMGLTDRMAT